MCMEGYTQHGISKEQLTNALIGDKTGYSNEFWDYQDQQDWNGNGFWSGERKYIW